MLRFNLDRAVKLSYFDQVKGQLLSAIYCGKIEDGERLPAIRELADDLGVNYKTIRSIYQRLAGEGLIEIVPGSGAFLVERTGENNYASMRRSAIYRLLQEVSDKARSLGLKPERLVALLDAYTSGKNLKKLTLAVVDDAEEAFIFSRELSDRLTAQVVPISLDEVTEAPSLERLKAADYLLTTSWHMEEVKKLALELGSRVIEIKPSHQIYTEVLTAARDHNIAIVVRDERTLHASWEVFMNIYHPSTEKQFWIAPIQRTDLIERIVQEADLIFVSPMCWDEMRRLTPTDKELKTYENFISESTINELRELQLLG